MRRETAWLQTASDEAFATFERFEALSLERGIAWMEALESAVASLRAFPFRGAPVPTTAAFLVRKIRVRPFEYWLFYTNYPSVDLSTGEGLDVVHLLACHHEKQGEPNWSARDPFRLP